jgi:hypothetical protein
LSAGLVFVVWVSMSMSYPVNGLVVARLAK